MVIGIFKEARSASTASYSAQIEKTLQPLPNYPSLKASFLNAPLIPKEPLPREGPSFFILTKVLVDNVPIEKEAEKIFEPFMGQEISWNQLEELTRRLIQFYRDKGWFLAKLRLVNPKVENGVVNFHLSPGYVESVVYKGDTSRITKRLEAFVNNIKEARPLTQAIVERNLLLINSLPGVFAQIVFDKSKETQETAGIILLVKSQKTSGSFSLNNDGENYSGPWQGMGQMSFNNMLNEDDQLTLTIGAAPEQRNMYLIQGAYSHPISNNGWMLSFMANMVKVHPTGSLAPLAIQGTTNTVQVELAYPCLLDRIQALYVGAQFQAIQEKQTIGSTNTHQEDGVRTIVALLNYNISDKWGGENLLQMNLSKGLPLLGATPNSSPNKTVSQGRTDFFLTGLYFKRSQKLWKGLKAIFSLEGQLSTSPLVASQQFSIGGVPFNRTYPSIFSGDSGIQWKIEMNRSFFEERLTPYIYFAEGKVWNMKPTASEKSYITLEGIGFGIRSVFPNGVSGHIEYDRPLRNHPITGGVPDKISVALKVQF